MSRLPIVVGTASATALLIGLAAAGSPALAQPIDRSTSLERITVIAPRIAHRRESVTGRVEVQTAEKTAFVDYADLDLTRTADLYRLQDRVVDAAEVVCQELAELYPEGEPKLSTCIARAIDDAMVLVQQAARREVSVASTEWD